MPVVLWPADAGQARKLAFQPQSRLNSKPQLPRPYEPHCAPHENFLSLMKTQTKSWYYGTFNKSHPRPWAAALQGKIIGQLFAHALSVRAPKNFFCGAVSDLPLAWPREWGDFFVVKPLSGYNDAGILLITNARSKGYDRLTGRRVRGRTDVAMHYTSNRSKLSSRQARTVLVEELIVRRRSDNAWLAADIKFFMFGGTIGAVYIIVNRSTPSKCSWWLAPDGQTRLDLNGCEVRNHPGSGRQGSKIYPATRRPPWDGTPRPCSQPPPAFAPHVWDKLRNAASVLGAAAGVPYRVDLFLGEGDEPVFGEMTSTHSAALSHCAIPTMPNGTVDTCYMGRLWHSSQANPSLSGRPVALRPPPFLSSSRLVSSLTKSVEWSAQQCKLARLTRDTHTHFLS